jgi:hypothetical protein
VPDRRSIFRLLALAGFLLTVALALWLAELRPLFVIIVMAAALLVAWTIEWLSWRQDMLRMGMETVTVGEEEGFALVRLLAPLPRSRSLRPDRSGGPVGSQPGARPVPVENRARAARANRSARSGRGRAASPEPEPEAAPAPGRRGLRFGRFRPAAFPARAGGASRHAVRPAASREHLDLRLR